MAWSIFVNRREAEIQSLQEQRLEVIKQALQVGAIPAPIQKLAARKL